MNPGIERFLILGCIAILILEAPSLLGDLRFGDGSAAVLAAELQATEAPALVEAVPAEPAEPVLLGAEEDPETLAMVGRPPVLLPVQPGL